MLFCLLTISVLVVLTCAAATYEQVDESDFFSYRRLFLDNNVLGRLSGGGKVRKDLRTFESRFTDGIYAISAGQLQEAERDLLEARKAWPEYFNTDFLLALIYEGYGDYNTAARYYKSYLNKLRNFHAGKYRISGALIQSLSYSGVEQYDVAYGMIKEHLALYGIDLDRSRPVLDSPGFLFPLLLLIALCAVYLIFHHHIGPYLKKLHDVRHPPEGFWVCRRCGTANPEPARECEECGRLRDEDHE